MAKVGTPLYKTAPPPIPYRSYIKEEPLDEVFVASQVMIQAKKQVLVKLLPCYVIVWGNDFF